VRKNTWSRAAAFGANPKFTVFEKQSRATAGCDCVDVQMRSLNRYAGNLAVENVLEALAVVSLRLLGD
jgi:hypothetical protein